MAAKNKFGHCELCNRTTHLTFHHLIPRKLHRRKHFKKRYDKSSLDAGIDLCRDCHKGIHKLFDEMTLGKELNTKAQLLAHPSVSRHCEWVARQKLLKTGSSTQK